MPLGGSMMMLWQLAITSEMVGLEANIALEVILMIANIQTLGVPIRYASVPGTIAAATGVFLIPCLGYVLDKWAKSKTSKARILTFTTMIQFAGSLLVLLANALKLTLDYAETSDILNVTSTGNLTDNLFIPGVDFAGHNDTIQRNLFAGLDAMVPDFEGLNQSGKIALWPNHLNQSIATHVSDIFSRDSLSNPLTQSPTGSPHVPKAATNLPLTKNSESHSGGDEAIPFYAYIAMVGYTMLDCGYDSSNCFLKTFVLHCTPAEYHVSVIVKAVMVSSVGGVLISILGSIDLGQTLTEGTSYDSTSALVCFLSVLSNLILIAGVISTFTSGFCWKPPFYRKEDDSEKAQLVTSKSRNQNGLATNSNTSKRILERSYSRTPMITSTSMVIDKDEVVDAVKLDEPARPGLLGFIQRQKKQILVNISAFFLISSLYSFEVFVVNFLGTRVFRGDPAASSDSEAYGRYLDGVAVGSQGTLIYYITFAITNVFHERSLKFFGWKKESLCASLIYAVLTVASAVSEELWVFYIVAAWTGIFRAISVTVPYILANQISAEQNGGKSSGTAMAMVAAMLPSGFLVCSALMGPMIDATGNAAVSMYYSGVCALLGAISIAPLKT